MRKSLTHFETIPVAVVRKIAKPLPRRSGSPLVAMRRSSLVVKAMCSVHSSLEREIEMGDSKENDCEQTNGDWRELAFRVQQESDPKKMIELAVELVAKLDEQKAGKNLLLKQRTESPERSRE